MKDCKWWYTFRNEKQGLVTGDATNKKINHAKTEKITDAGFYKVTAEVRSIAGKEMKSCDMSVTYNNVCVDD